MKKRHVWIYVNVILIGLQLQLFCISLNLVIFPKGWMKERQIRLVFMLEK